MAPVEPADTDIPARADDAPSDDVVARLLLALTALYVQRSNHTAEEQRQYTELALGLIDRAGPAARAAVADRLRRHPDAPAVVIDRLGNTGPHDDRADGDPPDAGPDLLARKHVEGRIEDHRHDRLRDADPPAGDASESGPFQVLADSGPTGGSPSDAEAGSMQQPPEQIPVTCDRRTALPSPAGLARGSIPGSGSAMTPSCDSKRPETALTPQFGEAFFAASSPERRRMLAEVGCAGAVEAAPEHGRRFHVRIDVAPWLGRTGAFARDFQRLIDAPSNLCARILDDPSGEPLVIAARATGMPAAILQRILLLVSPAAHHSVESVYELTDLYYSLDRRIARDLLDLWRGAARDASPGGGQPAADPPVTNLRARLRALNTRIKSKADR